MYSFHLRSLFYLFIALAIFLPSKAKNEDVGANGMSEVKAKSWVDDNRIPNSTYATHYDLYLNPDMVTKTFSGSVRIHIDSSEDRDYFLVNVKLLTIGQNDLTLERIEGVNRIPIPIVNAFEYQPNEFYVVQTDVVPAGKYELFMTFEGSLANKIIGFYYSEYMTEAGDKVSLATTKFEPTYARQAFPCFDEPSFRSTYNVTIVRPSGNNYIGLSNMPVINEVVDAPSSGLTEVTFDKSASMVTYLVCFIVCDFTYLETIIHDTLPFRVYAPADKIANMQYALDFGAQTLEYYEIMFDFPFPLPKSDMAAIPDYSSGATEHWGIITYREKNIIYNQNVSSTRNFQRISSVIAHEMAHQWFGNLVTLMWWNDLWLNEGFASYVEYIGVDHAHPSWDMLSQFVIDSLQYVFILDSKLSSHPIVQTVETPDQINAMFDSISYDKGSSVLRMLEGFMGEANYQTGINNFLKDFAFKNAVTQDLWDELTAAWASSVPDGYKTDIGDIMNTWTVQMGYPVVNVVRSSPTELTFTQARFLQDPNAVFDPSDSPFGYKWDIPLSVIASDNPSAVVTDWLYREMDSCIITVDASVSWFKVNYRQKGYYRINYSPEIWAELELLCASLTFTPEDRSSLYDDALALADAALLDYGIALNLTRSLVSENHYVPWAAASNKLEVMEYLLLETDILTSFKSYVGELVEPIYTTLQWQDAGTHLDRLLRYVVVDLASMSNVSSSLEEAGTLLQSWIDDQAFALPLDTSRKVYWWGMINAGSQNTWNTMWDRCMAELDAATRDDLYYGLANSQDTDTLSNYITLAQDENNVKSQDFINILQYISLNPAGMDLVWLWVRENWDWLVDRYTLNDRYLGQLIPNISKYFATPKKLAEMELFFARNPEAGAGELYRQQALETVKYNIFWVNNFSPIIMDWLNSR